MSPALNRRETRLREVRSHAQGHATLQMRCWNASPGLPDPEPQAPNHHTLLLPAMPAFHAPPPRNMFEKKEHQCLHPKSSRLHTDSLGRSTISEHVANVPRIKERQRQRHNPCGGRDRSSTGSGRPPGCTTIFPGLFVVPMPTATPAEMASVIRMTMNQNIFKMEIIF